MSRERKYQQGEFENYFPLRDEVRDDGDGSGYEVRRRGAHEVGGAPEPDTPKPGPYRGKGPRDYTRRDERILEEFSDRLCDNSYIDASEIDVSVAQGVVVLTGTVENRESKRLAEDIAESISGVKEVENKLRVKVRGI
jgi:osmotically-inducible protein OsmY